MSLEAIGSILAQCAFDPKHPNAPCNDAIVQSDDALKVVVFVALAVVLIVAGLLMRALWRRNDRSARVGSQGEA